MDILAQAVSFKVLLLSAFVGSAAYVHLRGNVRHRLTRQLSDHSTFLAPFNLFMYAFSAVPNKPILDVSDVPSILVLRDNWRVFRDEAKALMGVGEIKVSEKYDDLGFNLFFRRGWKRFYLKWYGDDLPSSREMCPRTVELLGQVPQVKAAMFALLLPGGRLVQHRDPFAGSLRYHLGLITPNDAKCRIYVDGQEYSWRDGQDILFDETYIHWAINRPCDPVCRCGAAHALSLGRSGPTLSGRHPGARNRHREGDEVGWANRVFRYIYWFRLQGKALKKYNRKLYYRLKYATGIAVLALILLWGWISMHCQRTMASKDTVRRL